MEMIDVRFSLDAKTLLMSMIGKVFQCYKCDLFENSPSAYGVVGIKVDDTGYAFTNFVKVADYFGKAEDVAMFKLKQIDYNEIKSPYRMPNMVEINVEKIISKIIIINEKQTLFENNLKKYEVNVTRGVIFKFRDGDELSLEKNIWFSEEITVRNGCDLINLFEPVEEFYEAWSTPCRGECIREMVVIK